MKHSRRILSLLLCLILTVSPWTGVLSEEAPEAESAGEAEVVIELEPDAPEDVPAEPAPEPVLDAPEDVPAEPAPEPVPDEGADAPEAAPVEPAPEPDEVADDPGAGEDSEGAPPALVAEEPAPADALGEPNAPLPLDSEAAGDAPGLFSAGLILPLDSVALGVGEKRDIGATFSDGGKYPIEYRSDNSRIASVSSSGRITARKVGSAEITLTSEYGTATLPVTVGKKPTGIKLSAPRKLMGAPDGESEDQLQLQSVLKPSSARSKLRYSSSNKSVVTVDENGLVTAHKSGKATVTVKTYNGKKGSVKLTVKAAPEGVELSGCAPELGLEETGRAAAVFPSGSAGGCSFASSAPGVLEIDPDTGNFTARGIGAARVSVETYNGKRFEMDVAVRAAPEAIALSLTEATLGVGESMDFPEVTLSANGAACAGGVRFSSKNTKRAAITSNGRIKAKARGNVRIVATTYNQKTADFLLHIVKAPTKLTLSAHHATLGVGEELQLGRKFKPSGATSKLTYSSGNSDLATVTEDGLVTAVAPGAVKISARTYNKRNAFVKFTVVPAPDSISLPDALTMGVSESYTIPTATLPEGSGGGRTYSIGDESVATIDPASGKIKAKAGGSTTVRVETYNGKTAECALTVKAKPTGISLNDKNFTLSAGDTRQLKLPTVKGEDPGYAAIKYKSSNTKIVKVNSSGVVTAVKAGSAKITASVYNKTSKSIKVTVKAAPKSISFAATKYRLLLDHEYVPKVNFSNKVSAQYSLTSADPAIAEIEEDGRTIYAKAPGEVEITAKSYNGKVTKAPLKLTIPRLPDYVWFEPGELALGAGDSAEMNVLMDEDEGSDLTFSVDDGAIASFESVDSDTVKVIAQSMGTTTLRVATQDPGVTQSATIRVFKAPSTLTVTPSSAVRSLDEGTLQLATSFGDSAEGGRISFSSSDASIATVDENGLVTFQKTGSVEITAQSYNGHRATCALTIGRKPSSMAFDREEYLVALGDTVQLPVTFDKNCCESYALSSSNSTAVAIVPGPMDQVKGLSAGASATVTARSASGLTASCNVRVVAAPTGIVLDATELNLVAMVDKTRKLVATPLPDGVGSVRFLSDNPSVAAVDSATGVITPLGSGDAVIRAVTYDGRYSAECRVHVTLPLEGWKIGIDPGHQGTGDMSRERMFPHKSGSKAKCAAASAGVAHVREDVINLQVSKKLRDALEKLGAEVVMTRTTANVKISNQQRAKLMNQEHVDFALRIHCNSWSSSSANGLSIIRRRSCDYSNKELTSYYGKSYKGSTLMSKEKKLGEKIATYFKKATGAKWRGLGTSDDYTMNNWSKVPCLLVELGFMTHPTEGKNLVKASYQTKMVKGIVNGICAYAGAPLPKVW